MQVEIKHFNELTLNEFHDLIALRIQVFVIEQECPYQELDGKDNVGYHLILRNEEGAIIGTTRILPEGISYPEIAIGRVVVAENFRYLKLGHLLMEKSIQFIEEKFGKQDVRLSAQTHLVKYYASHGFASTGKEYLEDGIPHTEMLLKVKPE
ncbi:GNAT family N-acetyltransferase [Crocinitomicaceae bacterium]|jgi:ElaA protein|nr:GNAT family N-acetyltransferase [Crocinitomicaceae bacterium]